MKMLLYHGSNQEVAVPDLSKSRKTLDFGIGFYLTSNEKQAIQYAEKVVLRAKKRREFPGVATVNTYELDVENAEHSLRCRVFEKPDEEWLDYVVANRDDKGTKGDYDVVIGPMANDDVYQVVEYYQDGGITKQIALRRLKVKKLFNQYVLKTEAAFAELHFKHSRNV
jgi:hypothetical protein